MDDREKMMEVLTDIQNLKQENKDLKQENKDLNLALKDLNEKMKVESNAQMDIMSRIEMIQDVNQNLSQELAVIKEAISFNKGLMTEYGKPKEKNETLSQEMTQVNKVPEVTKKNMTETCNVMTVPNGQYKHTGNVISLGERIDPDATMAVSLRGSGYITVPVSEDDLSQSLTTTVNMMIKPTNVDGPVAVIQIKYVVSYVLSMKAGNPILSILNENGDDVKELHLHYPLNTSRWYRLHLTRYTNNIDLRITDSEDIKAGTRNNLTVTSLPASQAEPAVIYFGGTPEGYPKYGNGNWQGCLAEVAINGRYLNLVQRDSSGVITPLCQDSRAQDLAAGIVFGGSGHVRFPLSTMSTGPVQSVNIDFRTMFKDGLIFFIRNSLQGFQGWMSLQAGHILVEFRTSKGSTIIKSKENTYSDGKIHELEIEVQQDGIHVSVDTGTDTFEPELSSHSISFDVHNGLYLAGLPGTQAATDSRFRSLHACIRQVHVNGVNIPFALADEAEDVHYGRCGHGVRLEEWASCFKFSDSSTPIEVPESAQGRSLYLSFTRGSLGPIVQYIKKDKFSITLSLDTTGIDIFESFHEGNARLEYDDSIQQGDLMIVGVKDEGKGSVIVSLGKESAKVTYLFSIWGGFGNNSAVYSFLIGGLHDSDVKFTGEIINVIVDERPVHLIAHMNENNLQPCTVPRRRPIETKVEEKLVC